MKQHKKNSIVGWKLALVAVAMFGFGYLMVPLYDAICELTGLNGKVGRAEVETMKPMTVDASRDITVEFIANRNLAMNWQFEPNVDKFVVHPGKTYSTYYKVKNLSATDMIGQAVPSISPPAAASHFKKIECFCFDKQNLRAGETRDMEVRFIVSPDLPAHLSTISLSYTFFDVSKQAMQQGNMNNNT
ncbi:MAG: cytochrome c oxidase assembly protein [Gammaproteobacteria bacterium]|nr:cytochrome c oxidase assembly protein [Gammaproteobacteria bacterium]